MKIEVEEVAKCKYPFVTKDSEVLHTETANGFDNAATKDSIKDTVTHHLPVLLTTELILLSTSN